MNTLCPVGACRHPRPARAPARRTQVHQGRGLAGTRIESPAARHQRPPEDLQTRCAPPLASVGPPPAPRRTHARRSPHHHRFWPARARARPHSARLVPRCPRADAQRVPVSGVGMKRTRFYQDPDDPAAFGGRGTGPRPRRDRDRGGGWRRADADDSVDSEGEEGAEPTPGARARAPDRPPSPSRPVVRGLARCSVARRRREHEPVPSRRRALAAHRTARALTRVSRAPHQAKRWAHQPSPTRERSPVTAVAAVTALRAGETTPVATGESVHLGKATPGRRRGPVGGPSRPF